jgi:Leucine-rich repeat (LRR) protein
MAHWEITDLQQWNGETHVDVAELDLSNNDLDEIPQSVFKLISLKKLVLFSNNLQAVPVELFSLTNLEILDLTTNNITDIPPEIKNLTKLKTIYLNWNPIREVPKPVLEMENVECHIYYYQPSATVGGTRYSNENIQNIRQFASGYAIHTRDANAVFQFLQPIATNANDTTNMVNQLLSGLISQQTELSPLLNMNFDNVFSQQNNQSHRLSSQPPHGALIASPPIAENVGTEIDDIGEIP